MRLIVLDFETFYSPQHTLTKMLPVEYIMSPETELQTLAVMDGAGSPIDLYVGEAEIKRWAQETDFSDAMVVGHNLAGFDGLILAWRLHVNPKAWCCTRALALQMGLAQVGSGRVSLKHLALHFGLPDKLDFEATDTKGKRVRDFSPEELEALLEYNKHDTWLCYELFRRLAPQVGTRSLRLIDLTIRMATQPTFRMDTDLLQEAQEAIRADMDRSLEEIGTELADAAAGGLSVVELRELARSTLASAPKFAKLLQSRGVPVPMKPSPSNPDKQIPALAKTDAAMLALLEHDDEQIAAAAAARLQVSSTMLQTRIDSFLTVSQYMGNRMPICLQYYGAATGRWSGTMKLNHQNLPRVGKKPKRADVLRKCLLAPPGHRVVVADLSGIELRVNHYLWQVQESMAMFDADPVNTDLYRTFASVLYNVAVDKVTDDQRQMGKIAQLQLQYGAGPVKFRDIARQWGAVIDEAEAARVVVSWREKYSEIVYGWRCCTRALPLIADGVEGAPIDPWGLCVTAKEGIRTPQGMVRYPNLHRDEKQWLYGATARSKPIKIYGAKMVENLVQHLAREVMADMLLQISKRYFIAHTVHDEAVLVVPEAEAEEALQFVHGVMRSGVHWFPQLPTWSSGGTGRSYGEAK